MKDGISSKRLGTWGVGVCKNGDQDDVDDVDAAAADDDDDDDDHDVVVVSPFFERGCAKSPAASVSQRVVGTPRSKKLAMCRCFRP